MSGTEASGSIITFSYLLISGATAWVMPLE